MSTKDFEGKKIANRKWHVNNIFSLNQDSENKKLLKFFCHLLLPRNKIEGTLILKLSMVERLTTNKNLPKQNLTKNIRGKIRR